MKRRFLTSVLVGTVAAFGLVTGVGAQDEYPDDGSGGGGGGDDGDGGAAASCTSGTSNVCESTSTEKCVEWVWVGANG
ncbi:MAG: hypothetical protein ABJB66_10560, partial [Gemmatimonadaceae bacterium]